MVDERRQHTDPTPATPFDTEHSRAPDGRRVSIRCDDGDHLSGTFFEVDSPRGAVLVAPATAVPQEFYGPFCRWLVERGFSALIFDFRGIGASLGNRKLEDLSVRKQDWRQLDIPAAIAWLREHYSDLPLYLVGHSAGGQLVGLTHNHRELRAIVQVAASAGCVDETPRPFRWVARFLLSVYIPLMTKHFGYVPLEVIGWGEDIPAEVGRQ